MFGLTSLGVVHTAISLVAVAAGAIALKMLNSTSSHPKAVTIINRLREFIFILLNIR